MGVESKDIRTIDLIDDKSLSDFTLETKVSFNKPFDTKNDKFIFRVALKGKSEELVLPVKILKITVLSGEILIGELQLGGILNGVDDTINAKIPVSYVPEQPEEEKSLSYKIDYEFKVKREKRVDGQLVEEISEPIRKSFEKSFRSNVFFVRTGEVSE